MKRPTRFSEWMGIRSHPNGQEQQKGSMKFLSFATIVLVLLQLLASWPSLVAGAETGAAAGGSDGDDVACLREFKEAVTDPLRYLKNWDFRGRDINICNFLGVTCVRPDNPKVIALDLAAAGLGGKLSPNLLRKCSNLKDLNLSNNFFTGRIPPTICVHNRNLVNLDLSNNGFSGPYPSNLQKCLESNRQLRNYQPKEEISSGFITISSDDVREEDALQ